MKKLLALSLIVVLIFSALCACSSEESTTTTPDEAPKFDPAQIYFDNSAVWEVTDANSWFGYLFIDLDFDGTLELVQASRPSTSDQTSNRFFKIDKATNTVVEIPCTDENAKTLWDFTGGDYPQLYKNNQSSELKYMVYDNSREDIAIGGTRIGELYYDEENGFKTKSLWGFKYSTEDGSLDGEFEYTYTAYDKHEKPREISSGEYNSILSDYEVDNTNLMLKIKYIQQTTEEYTYSKLTGEEKLAVIREAYNTFSYNK